MALPQVDQRPVTVPSDETELVAGYHAERARQTAWLVDRLRLEP